MTGMRVVGDPDDEHEALCNPPQIELRVREPDYDEAA